MHHVPERPRDSAPGTEWWIRSLELAARLAPHRVRALRTFAGPSGVLSLIGLAPEGDDPHRAARLRRRLDQLLIIYFPDGSRLNRVVDGSYLEAAIERGPIAYSIRRPNGVLVEIEPRVWVQDDDENLYTAIVREVGERHREERALEEANGTTISPPWRHTTSAGRSPRSGHPPSS